MRFFAGLLNRLVFAAVLVAGLAALSAPASAQNVVVQGNRRVDTETIRSYFTGTTQQSDNAAVKELLATNLYSDVRARREGGRVVVTVVENNIINRVAFEGNSKLKSEQLAPELQSKSRGPYNPATVQADIARLQDIYKRSGRGAAKITSRLVDLPNGRVDVVFTIDEGGKTGVREINFAGNGIYSSGKLRGLMQTTEMNYLSWLKSTDVYDPDKIATDQELIRRYYLKNGYADFRIVSSDARYDDVKQGWIVTLTVEEGPQYRVSTVRVDSRIADVDSATLVREVKLSEGDVYDGVQVEKSVEALNRAVSRSGYAFVQVRPRGDRDPAAQTISLSFTIDEGPRVYVERVNIRGNTRTRDYVIRRAFEIGEGDAYNRVLIDQGERRLNGLGFFKKVRITNEPGSTADRVLVNVEVEDQPTGSFSIAGGYSTTDGVIAEVSLSESNFLGRGQFVRIAAQNGQRARGVDFSFTEPYFLDRHLAAGFDLFSKQTDNSKYARYINWVTGGTLRLGIPFTDEITLTPRYSLYTSRIKIPNTSSQPYDDCTTPIDGTTPGFGTLAATTPATSTVNCLTNGEASIAVKESRGSRLTSLVGYTLSYNTLDSPKDPTSGIYAEVRQDFAGLGGQSRFVRQTGEARYYREVYDQVVGIARLQGGNIIGYGGSGLRLTDHFNLGPNLVRGFAPSGIGPRDVTNPTDFKANPLGGTTYAGASLEFQFPLGLPRELGIKGAVFADAGTLFGYRGKKQFDVNRNGFIDGFAGGVCTQPLTTQAECITVRDAKTIRSSVGASIIWQSPLGPIRFDYAFALSKDKNDVTQAFRFGGGTSF